MTSEPAVERTLAVAIEYADPALLGVDAANGSFPELIQTCGEVLLACGADPVRTRLVITGDFVQSVRDRGEPDSEYHQNYDTRRNDGVVVGKTIDRDDNTVDVLLQGGLFLVDGEDDQLAFQTETAIRTLVHEAQHVVTRQNGEDGSTFEESEWARRNFLTAADEVIEEYRAERVATRLVGPGGWNTAGLVGTARTWLNDLQRIALEEYQQHLDTRRLSYDILQETHTVWKLLAYVAAELAEGDASLPDAVAEDALWVRMVQPYWDEFTELLGAVPDAHSRVNRVRLDEHAASIADLFEQWLLSLGFEFADTPEGSAFWIRDFGLLGAGLGELDG